MPKSAVISIVESAVPHVPDELHDGPLVGRDAVAPHPDVLVAAAEARVPAAEEVHHPGRDLDAGALAEQRPLELEEAALAGLAAGWAATADERDESRASRSVAKLITLRRLDRTSTLPTRHSWLLTRQQHSLPPLPALRWPVTTFLNPGSETKLFPVSTSLGDS